MLELAFWSPFSLLASLLSLDMKGRRALVLLRSKVLEFFDSPWEAFPSRRIDGGWGGEKQEVAGGGEGVGTRIGLKDKEKFKKKSK